MLLQVLLSPGGTCGTAGTELHGTKLSIERWAKAARLYTRRDGLVTLSEIQVACKVSHRTAWRVRAKLREIHSYLIGR